ncbi:hypothetical protein LC605_15930 [Nostoc sp. CHAB 5836]|uniref:hypothetical protein n=1 Tax=Nostoc sp. CHAB 5836 TaxID=2780404 RepID=UPI001E5BC464|nr:hypothetical protein [Nostoc sp. CHAB 5836]MCC5616534.1 hypothetical protein [Nostoc sp. CHAB 5836]
MNIKKVYRAWVEVKGEPIAAYAMPHSVKITESEAQLTFKLQPECAEISAIALGKQYRVDYDARSIEMLEAKPKSRSGRLKNSNGQTNFQIVEEELSSAIAYYLTDSNEKSGEGVGLEIMPHRDDVTEDDQIAINSEGRIYVSSNVKDKVVKVRTVVIYKRVVVVLPELLDEVRSHFVCLWGDGDIKYVGVKGKVQTGGVISPKNQMRTVKIDVDEVKVESLCGIG